MATTPNGKTTPSITELPAAASLIPRRSIMLDRPRTMVIDLNAMVMAETVTGLNMLDDAGWWSGHLWSATTARAALWASLLADDPSLGEQAPDGAYPGIALVGSWIAPTRVNDVLRTLNSVWNEAMPTPEDVAASPTSDDPNAEPPAD